ncbi:hypothetical protein EDB81DRAFT_767618 [Dactylonectria macrodidyma]|uniref:Uncharacterized protein n=1 Tax=Dactylonectria macrodidyma TaxID=307937 RepID=A0A9P9IDP8_9HYPO|nr:hypothetical protein EDB81DRAFT_767618 [Dactylonectria macrodidyma]
MSYSAHGKWTTSQPPQATSPWRTAGTASMLPQNPEGRFDMDDLEGDFNFINPNNPELFDNAQHLEAPYEEMKWGIQNLRRPPQGGRGSQELSRGTGRPREL